MAFVYLISEEGDNHLCKIGVTRSANINDRIKVLQTGNGNKLYLRESFKSDDAFQIEKMLHFYYSKEREEGEWFLLSDEQIAEFAGKCEFYQEIVNSLKKQEDADIYI